MMWVSVIISTKQWQKALIWENLSNGRDEIKNSGKRMQNTKKDLKILKQWREYEKQTFYKGKVSNPEHSRELNRKAQNHLRKAMQSSRLNQAEICQGQDSIRHSMSKVIQSFRDKITHGPEYICTCCDHLWFRPSVSKGAFLLSELAGQTHQFAKKMQQFEGTLAW